MALESRWLPVARRQIASPNDNLPSADDCFDKLVDTLGTLRFVDYDPGPQIKSRPGRAG